MAVSVERTIHTRGKSKAHWDEGVLDTAASPGMHIAMAADGKYDPSPAATAELAKVRPKVVREDSYQGKTVNDAYIIGDRVFYFTPMPGDHCLLLIKSGQNIVVGDTIIAEGGGTGLWIEAAGTEAAYHFQALDSSAGVLGANGLIKCECLK